MTHAPPPDFDDIPSVRMPTPAEVPGKVLGLADAMRRHRMESAQKHQAAKERDTEQTSAVNALRSEVGALREDMRRWLVRVVFAVATGSLGVITAVGGGAFWVGQRTAEVDNNSDRIVDLHERVRDLEKQR